MRFAGVATSSYAGAPKIESFLDKNAPDMGEVSMAADNLRAKEYVTGVKLQGDTVARGISAAGRVAATEIEGLGMAALNDAHINSAVMSGIGNVVSGGLSAIPKGGGGGGSNYIPGVEGQDSTTNYSWNAPASQYEPGAISTPGWTWADL